MTQNIKVSIIIPVYNVEKYLTECLESATKQTLKEIEIICINDGSTDNSLEIIKKFTNKDNRIIIIDKKNEGVSSARNAGIDIARGEYIMFLDGDDYYTIDACEKAYSQITSENADIGIFGYSQLENNIISESYRFKEIKRILKKDKNADYFLFNSVWERIWKTQFIKDKKMKFIENAQTAEDVVFVCTSIFHSPKTIFINNSLYIYRMNRNGSLTTLNKNGIKSNLEILKKFHNTPIFKKQTKEYQLKTIQKFCSGCLYFYNKFDKKEQKILIKDIKTTIKFLELNYQKKDLLTITAYEQIKYLTRPYLLNKIYSANNFENKTHKIIRICGIKIKIKK